MDDKGNYAPASPQEYEKIPPGSAYQHPNDPPGTLRRKPLPKDESRLP